MNFDSETGIFEASIKVNGDIRAPTTIHVLNKSVRDESAWYEKGANLSLSIDG